MAAEYWRVGGEFGSLGRNQRAGGVVIRVSEFDQLIKYDWMGLFVPRWSLTAKHTNV